uniref:F420-non-reducing hydrogenase vhc subunit G n=1 Tax=Anthurium amnicola TaxID=1678845 RepID=A0A1D1YE89_9ARAE
MIVTSSNGLFPAGSLRGPRRRGGTPATAARSVRFSKKCRRPPTAAGRRTLCTRSALITNPDDFEVGRFLGSYGFMNVTSYSSFQSGGLFSGERVEELNFRSSSEDIERLKVQDVGEGQVKIRLYEGRIVQGPLRGTRITFKVYPGQRAGGVEADMMAANELNAHAFLQGETGCGCHNIQILLGGFETKMGEQWLAFHNNGIYSSADYAKVMADDVSKYQAEGGQRSWNPFDWEQKIKQRRKFVIKLFYGAMNGLAYMHRNDRLHQSLGPASVVLNTIMEKDVAYLVPRLRDLSFSVDVRYSSLEAGPGALSEGLWRRASAAGAFTLLERRAFGIADDM